MPWEGYHDKDKSDKRKDRNDAVGNLSDHPEIIVRLVATTVPTKVATDGGDKSANHLLS
jgi:hypothetical protein